MQCTNALKFYQSFTALMYKVSPRTCVGITLEFMRNAESQPNILLRTIKSESAF